MMLRFTLAVFLLACTINISAQEDVRSKIEAQLPAAPQPLYPMEAPADYSPPPARPEAPAIPTTTIEFFEETHEFGEIEEGDIFTHVFTFTNTGNEPLIITNARGSCGCTVPEYPRAPIAPGETASLTVEFNSRNKSGERNQRVTITANTEPAQSFLYLHGTVIDKPDDEEGYLEEPAVEPEVAISPDCFAIFPNPTAELLNLEVEESSFGEPAQVVIYSKMGELMAKRDVSSVSGTIQFDVRHYPAGEYIAHVQIGDRRPEARCFVVVH